MRHVSLAHPRWSLADHALPLAGLLSLVLGSIEPAVLPLAWALLGLTLLAWMAEVEGVPVPRPGRVPILPYGCWEVPQAFVVRHGTRYLLLTREEDPVEGGWSDSYTVRELADTGESGLRGWRGAFPAPTEWTGRTLGQVPARRLCFEHHERSSYVVRSSLDQALRQAGCR